MQPGRPTRCSLDASQGGALVEGAGNPARGRIACRKPARAPLHWGLMCTLILARDVLGPATLLLAANRDESPGRPTDPPLVLNGNPRIAGGRDRLAGGTWLAVREGPAVVALLNRRDPAPGRAGVRSRGLLTLDLARAPVAKARDRVVALASEAAYAPFTLLYGAPEDCWLLVNDGARAPRILDIAAGWHALTHQDLDDPSEPRAAYLVERLRRDPPPREAAEETLAALLREHGENGTPPVCLHEGRMRTVSSSIVRLGPDGVRYLHAEGRPCEHAFQDQARLLEPAPQGGRS